MYTKGKKDVANALSTITGVTVTASYTKAMKNLPSILYSEVVNVPANKGSEKRTQLAYSIDIYSKTSTTYIASKVDEVLSALGLRRGQCLDLDQPDSETEVLRHKNMKYTAVYDANTNRYYHE